MSMKPNVVALVAVAALSACSSMAPEYKRPAAPVPAQITEPAGPGSTAAPDATAATAAQDIAWQDFFVDPALQDLIRTALANNRDLRVAVLTVEQFHAQVDVKNADRWPTIDAGLSVSRATTVGVPLGTVYSAGALVTSYEFDLFGRLKSLSDAALAQYLATVEAGKAVQISLVGAVASAYYGLRADLQLEQLAGQTVQTREDSMRLMQLRFKHGASSQLDLSQADTLLQTARASLAQAQRQVVQDENALALLLGQALSADQRSAMRSGTVAVPSLQPTALPSSLLLRRPDVIQAEQQLIAANANIGAARAAFFPKITLSSSIGSASSDLSGLFQDGTFAWSIAPQLLLPIFDAGRNKANFRSAVASRDIALAQYEKAIQSAFREVADALAARTSLNQQLQAQQALTQAARRTAELTELRYKNGASSFLDQLDAQRTLFAAQQAELQVQGQIQQNLATLYRVLGGGWTDPDKT